MKKKCLSLYELGSPVRFGKGKRRIQFLNAIQIEAFSSILNLMIEIVLLLESIKNSKVEFFKDQVKILVESLPDKLHISEQRLADIQLELRRFQLMVSNSFIKH